MKSILEAVHELHTIDWEIFDGDHDGYDGPMTSGPVDEEATRKPLARRGECRIPLVVWDRCVPGQVLWHIKSCDLDGSKVNCES